MRKASNMQLKAICHNLGPARVLAGPGSGKTFTIIQRIHYLVQNYHISPENILCVTFSKAAAIEMQQRYESECHDRQSVHFATLHSICYYILKNSGGFQNYTLIKDSEKNKILENLLINNGYHEEITYDVIADVLAAISKKKNSIMDDSFAVSFLSEEQFTKIVLEYENMLRERKRIDYDDMILKAYQLLSTKKSVCDYWRKRFSYIMVDEFQDMNELQYKIIKLLSYPTNNLFVVGDDDQAVYGFRGAKQGIMEQFVSDYPRCSQLILAENYRCKSEIVKVADKMISQNEKRIFKIPMPIMQGGEINIYYQKTRKEEEALLLSHLKALSSHHITESAVILRTNREVYQYKVLLKNADIPINESKRPDDDYLHHFVTEDIKSFLKFAYEGNKRKDFLKIMNKPERYLSQLALRDDIVTEEILKQYYGKNIQMQKKIKELFFHFRRISNMSPALAIRYFRNVMGYDNYLSQKASNKKEKELWISNANKVQELFLQKNPQKTVDDFFSEIEENGAILKDEPIKGVSVITMHRAKGLEFSHVFLPDLNEGVIPERKCKTKESLEEERRLLYVAITRAKEKLFLYYTGERNRKPSRFLDNVLKNKIIQNQ